MLGNWPALKQTALLSVHVGHNYLACQLTIIRLESVVKEDFRREWVFALYVSLHEVRSQVTWKVVQMAGVTEIYAAKAMLDSQMFDIGKTGLESDFLCFI